MKKLNKRNAGWKLQYDSAAVIKRALALSYVCLLSEALGSGSKDDEKLIMGLINDSGLREHFTKKETEFADGKRTEQDIADFNWHYERLAVLLWALGSKVSLNDWGTMAGAVALISITNGGDFVKKAKLVKQKKIAQYEREANEAYWICVDAKINGKPISAYTKKDIDPEIAAERLTAVRWLYSDEKTEWDACSPDTYFPYAVLGGKGN